MKERTVRVRVTLQLTMSQSVLELSPSVTHDLILVMSFNAIFQHSVPTSQKTSFNSVTNRL